MSNLVVEAKGLTKVYQMGDVEVHALRGLDINISESEVISIMGPSGSGKSTLMNMLGCLDRPTSGSYLLDGEQVSVLSDDQLAEIRNRKVGFVFQAFLLIEDLTAFENVQSVLWPSVDHTKEKQEEKALEVLREVDMLERRDHFPRQMSGGEQQRIAIARALVNDPPILFCDEPTGNLDSKTGENIMKIIAQLNREKNMTVVLVTHNEDLVKFAKRTLRMKDGVLR